MFPRVSCSRSQEYSRGRETKTMTTKSNKNKPAASHETKEKEHRHIGNTVKCILRSIMYAKNYRWTAQCDTLQYHIAPDNRLTACHLATLACVLETMTRQCKETALNKFIRIKMEQGEANRTESNRIESNQIGRDQTSHIKTNPERASLGSHHASAYRCLRHGH